MGAVYRAERIRSGGEPVAVKLIKRGMDTDSVLRRFHNERHILAALEHPNIARLLATGTTEDGMPYVVMEFIQGPRLTEYCDQLHLPVQARLELFRKVCAAVECAHKKQVVHRDLKPSNILVTPEGEPKLLDFGIAKILDRDLLALTAENTQTHLPVMTPQYASPEQARGEPVGPASDIYSLGVLLYEMLTGHRPYRVNTRSAHEVIRAICEQMPERPSTAVLRTDATTNATPETISAARSDDPRELKRRISGDLDAILIRALAKNPAKRYPSAREFSEDIRRHLEGLPVKAPHPTILYERSMRARLAVAALVAVLLAVGTWLAVRTRTQRVKVRPSVAVMGFENLSRQASTEWLSTALTEMLSTELAAGGQLRTLPGERVSQVKLELSLPAAQTLAVPTLERLRRSLGADYVVVGSYLAMGGKVRVDIRLQDARAGEVVAAVTDTEEQSDLLALVNRSGASLRRKLGAGEVQAADVASLRGSLPENPEAARVYAEGLERLRRFDTLAARELLQKAVAAAPEHALSHSALAQVSALLGYDPEARAQAKKALDLAGGLGRENRLLIEGSYHEIMHAWDRAVDIFRTLHGYFPDNLEYGLRLAQVQTQSGAGRSALETLATLRRLPAAANDPRLDLAEAEAALAVSDLSRARDAAARAATAGKAQGLRILAARANLIASRTLTEQGDPQRALAAAGEARNLYEAAGVRQGVAWAVNDQAAVLTQTGDIPAARASYQQALEICRTTGDQACIGTDLDSIGVVLRRLGDLPGALQMHQQALEVRRNVGDRGGVATALYNIGNVREVMGDLPGARAAETESLDIRRSLGQKRTGALTMSRLADVRRRQGELGDALSMSRDAVAELRAIGDRGGVAMALNNYAHVMFDRGDLAGARAAWEEALGIRRSQRDKNNTAQVLAGLGPLAITEDRLHDARLYLEESGALRQALGEKIGMAQSRLLLAELVLEEGDAAAAEKMAEECAAEFARAGTTSLRAEAELTATSAALARKDPGAARRSLDSVRRLLRDSREIKLLVGLDLMSARVESALGRTAEAVRLAEKAQGEAGRAGFPGLELMSRLLLGKLGKASLQQVAADASQAGYKLVARKASAAE